MEGFRFWIMRAPFDEVLGDVLHDVEADEVVEAEAAGFWSADEGAGDGIDLFYAEAEFFGDVNGFVHRPHAEPVGDEPGGVFDRHNASRTLAFEESGCRVDGFEAGFRGRDEFEEFEIARGVEEVGS